MKKSLSVSLPYKERDYHSVTTVTLDELFFFRNNDGR